MNTNRSKNTAFVALGGTGVIGTALRKTLKAQGIYYISISLDPSGASDIFQNIQIDLKTCTQSYLNGVLDRLSEQFSVVGVLDIVGVRGHNADCISRFAESHGAGIGIISSCLLYKHKPDEVVDETFPTIAAKDAIHPYHVEKLKIEQYWLECSYDNWVLLRTHHILGRGALLGCIPNHNRDRSLLNDLAAGNPIALSNYGNVHFSYIHPDDLVLAALELIAANSAKSKIINLVHPKPALASEYYQEISKILEFPDPEIISFDADPAEFWSVTSVDNVFRSNNSLFQNFNFNKNIEDCIRDALSIGIEEYPKLGTHMMKRISGENYSSPGK